MKLLICLMGYQYSGIYVMENYLIEAYGIKKYKGYTSRKQKKNEADDKYVFSDIASMIQMDQEFIGWREYNGNFYARKLHEIPDGISVCVIDYNGYLELKQKVNTLPIYIDRGVRYRYMFSSTMEETTQITFLNRDANDKFQFDLLENDPDVLKVKYKGLNRAFLSIDNILAPLIKDLAYIKKVEEERLKIMYKKLKKRSKSY